MPNFFVLLGLEIVLLMPKVENNFQIYNKY